MRKSYKLSVFRYVFILTALLMLVFGIYTYYNDQKQYDENISRKVENTANRIVLQVDERFDNLRQYYITRADNDSIKWFLENNISYSDYSYYKTVYDDMSSEGIFADYWKGFALINFETDWILSNKGVFHLEEAYNKSDLVAIYDQISDGIKRKYWYYDEKPAVNTDTIDKGYRVTVDTSGLNFVMRLPVSSNNTNSLLIANINMDTWKNWISELSEDNEEIVVLDQQGNVIYTTDNNLTSFCQNLQVEGASDGKNKSGKERYIASAQKSNILGWNYYVLYNVTADTEIFGTPFLIFCFLCMWMFMGVFLISHLIYSPIDNLMKNVMTENATINNGDIEGNELDYLEGSFKNLSEDKKTLENRLMELFEIRLIHGEVNSEVISEYMVNFHLNHYKYYETTVIILKLGDDELQGTVNEDAICLKLIQEMPSELKNMAFMPPIYNASAIFAMFAEDDEDLLVSKVQQFDEQMKRYVKEMCGYDIIMGVSSTHENYNHIRAAYRESINAITSNGDGECNFYLSKVSEHDNNYNGAFERNIKAAMSNMDKAECHRIIDEFDKFIVDKVSYEMIPIYVARMADAILLSAVSTHVDLEKVYPDGVNKLYRELLQANEHSRIRRYLKGQLVDPLIIERKKRLEENSYMIMDRIEKKIAETKGNISVTECADALGVSPTYIWKVLKMEGGKSFSDYQDEYKLEEAKRLLMETDLSVVEIATQLNYTNAQNFIRFFSKKTGITPGKFRKL